MQTSNLHYIQAALWIVGGCCLSNLNDIIMKILSKNFDVFQIIFCRFFFSTLLVIPFIRKSWSSIFLTKKFLHHIQRVFIGALAIGLSCCSVSLLPIVDVTTLSFSQPIMFFPLAGIFLGEKMSLSRIFAAIIGFFGMLLVVLPREINFQYLMILPLFSSFLFCFLDISTKKLMKTEGLLGLIFYFSLGCTLITSPFLINSWRNPAIGDLGLFILLGGSAFLIQISIYKSFYNVELTSLSPFRYLELVFSCAFGILIFKEKPNMTTILGSFVIFSSALYITCKETNLFSFACFYNFILKNIEIFKRLGFGRLVIKE